MSAELISIIVGSPLFAALFAWIGGLRERKITARRQKIKTALEEIEVYNKIIDDLKQDRDFHYDELKSLRQKLDEFTEQNKELLKKVSQLEVDYSQLQKSYSSLQKSYKSLESQYKELLNQNSNDHEQN